ncbi:mucin-like protein [Ptychodera flava]|uniref:mucin-like protein n=1 Tax=Ptychodera flava TaxID=63121 RepID=UPI00396A4CA0
MAIWWSFLVVEMVQLVFVQALVRRRHIATLLLLPVFKGSYFCDLYAEKRPPGTCNGYFPPIWGWMLGDPHLKTLDGVSYTFNGLGEYTLVQVDDDFFKLQGRTARAITKNGTMSQATVFVAFAAKQQNSSTVQVKLTDDGTDYDVLVDGELFNKTFLDDQPFTPNGTNVSMSLKQEESTVGSGAKVRFVASFTSKMSISIGVAEKMLDVLFSAPEEFKGRVTGLLGFWDGDPTNDFKLPDGNIKQPTGDNFTDAEYFEFGQQWNISANQSIFWYEEGKSWSDYNDPTFEPLFLDELIDNYEREDPAYLSKVRSNCGDDQECLFDSLATEREEIGLLTRNSSTQIRQQQTDLGNFPPNVTIEGSSLLEVEVGKAVSLKLDATDPNPGDTITYMLADPVLGAHITQGKIIILHIQNILSTETWLQNRSNSDQIEANILFFLNRW